MLNSKRLNGEPRSTIINEAVWKKKERTMMIVVDKEEKNQHKLKTFLYI